ncbi:hypothetical protein HHL16_03810 [Pseudoflavitalea sp. G-6-1-2]|uniref:hypothetical protein n=1 Tax=Pseudoflavitalea sp. G-6-1-2 TaxID=2728841 RepID=UPI001469AD28|nr:hypothetical protein [Pseudoflavitalea sp. G-6-1-2]NML19983.1 hypothetical protein [Pseudoflavitalea sp. G-6-1-2]
MREPGNNNTTFQDLFDKFEFNGATVAAFYAMLLDNLKIDYKIYLGSIPYVKAFYGGKAVDFYPKSYPESDYAYIYSSKGSFYNYLKISKTHITEQGKKDNVEELFKRYFYDTAAINLKQLAALFYMNRGMEFFWKKNYTEAYRQMEKAYFLYPCHRVRWFTGISLGAIVTKGKLSEEEKIPYLERGVELGAVYNPDEFPELKPAASSKHP